MKLFIFLCLILCTLCFFSCSINNPDSSDKVNPDNSIEISAPAFDALFEKRKVIQKVRCASDSSVTYSLYLPSTYSADKKYPIIYFFDSHGNGSFPLEKYKDLAEKYEYILAGSNNSKNGIPWKQNHLQIQTFMNDVKNRLNIDDRRIYTCGFSGGSRVASSVAIFDVGINCVIGMGAGFPSINESIRNRFDYIGFAGNEDFNMHEMAALDSSMNRTPLRHQLIIFHGKHEWAPADIAEDAFVWNELNAMKAGLISRNDSLIKHVIAKSESALKEMDQKKKKYEQVLLCKKTSNFLDGIADVSAYTKKAEQLIGSEDFKKEMIQKNILAKQELFQQENYRNNVVLKDLPWWTNEIKKLNHFSKNKNGGEKAVMNKRLLNYLGLVAYMNAISALQSNQLNFMEKFLKIYEMLEPGNPEHQYLYADLYAIEKDISKALISLKNAVKFGFNDVVRMKTDTLFATLRDNAEYQKLVDQIGNSKDND